MTDRETLARILNGDATEDEISRFTAAAHSDFHLLVQYVRLAEIETALAIAYEDDISRAMIRGNILEALRTAERNRFVQGVDRRLRARRRLVLISKIAAAAAVCCGVLFWFSLWSRPVATVARMEGVTWPAGHGVPAGGKLKKGDMLSISNGLIELEMNGCGTIILEGPARLELISANAASFHSGRLVMNVTKKGRGYRIGTPQGEVVDLGTEFGLVVRHDGESEIHVIDGKVEVLPAGGAKELLSQDEAMNLGGGGTRIQADRTGFYTALPPHSKLAANYVHWSFDEGTGSAAATTERGLASGPKEMMLKSMEQGAPPCWVPAAFGFGLAFDGKGAYAESSFRGIEGGRPRTVCFWVKVPKDLGPREGFALISWGHFQFDAFGKAWQIAVNSIEADGPVGRIRVGAHGGNIIGTKDLRDGKWHHVAVVLYGGSQPDIGTHVIVYLDAKMEQISRRALREIMTDAQSAHHGVWMGRNLTYTESTPDHLHGGFFRGEMDEVYIFDTALSPDAVINLMENNILSE